MNDTKNSTIRSGSLSCARWPGSKNPVEVKQKQAFFTQGDPADSVFYLQKGPGQASPWFLRMVNRQHRTLLSVGDFVGEESPHRGAWDCASRRPLP